MEHSDITVGALVTAFFFISVSLSPEEERQAKKLPLVPDQECEDKISSFLNKDSSSTVSQLPAVHAPHFPGIKLPAWWALLYQARTDILQCSPVRISSIPLTCEFVQNPGTPLEPCLVLQFNAPNQVGTFVLSLEFKCDSLLNTDFSYEVKLNVVPAAQPRPGKYSHEDGDDSD